MKHTWQNIDSEGTIGWHRCSTCGYRVHFPNNEITDDEWRCECDERQRDAIKVLARKVTSLLHNYDCDTDEMRRLLAEAITAEKSDSVYLHLLDT